MLCLKVAMCIAASECSTLTIRQRHLEKAITKVELTEPGMGNAFRSVGKSLITGEVDTVMTIIRSNKKISRKNLMRAVWRDIDAMKFDNVINTVLATGRVKSTNVDSEGNVVYYYISD